ncbi:MAG: hypothetical protein FWC15_05095 [Fibromonadales bacterium]|nr:hypothetical protein [Fibromonadales bacterium]
MIEKVGNSPSMTPVISGSDTASYKTPTENEEKSSNYSYELALTEEGWKVLDEKSEKKEKANEKESEKGNAANASGAKELTEEDQRRVEELKKIDKKVRVHEQAHVSAAGGYARGGANYNFVTGPDGKRYASSGHVNLDTSPERTPEATIRKADVIRKAALAPAEPSTADRQIAADATKMAQNAQRELAAKRMESTSASSSYNPQMASESGQP